MLATDARILRDLLACVVGVGETADSTGQEPCGAALGAFDPGVCVGVAHLRDGHVEVFRV